MGDLSKEREGWGGGQVASSYITHPTGRDVLTKVDRYDHSGGIVDVWSSQFGCCVALLCARWWVRSGRWLEFGKSAVSHPRILKKSSSKGEVIRSEDSL